MNKSLAQAFFETTARHLFAQGSRCGKEVQDTLDPSATHYQCNYRIGTKTCAMGVHIPQSLYSPEMDKVTMDVNDLVQKFPKLKPIFYPYERNFLINLQSVHDNSANWKSSSYMRDALYTVADNWKLDGSFLDVLHFNPKLIPESTP